MAVRRPLYYDSGNLREMTDEQIAQIKARMFWAYVSNPSVTLSVVNSGGNLGTLTDTRLQAGAASTSVSSTPTEAETAEPTVVEVSISRIEQTIASDPNPATTTTQYPAYYEEDPTDLRVPAKNFKIRAMTFQDMIDTFAQDVFDGGWTASDGSTIYPSLIAAEIYTIHTTTSLTDYTVVPGPDGSTIIPVFSDTRADTSAYDPASIPEELDQPTTIQDYYLLKKDVPILPSLPAMVRVNATGNVVAMSNTAIDTAINAAIRYLVQEETGYKIRYEYGVNGSGTGTPVGSAMTDSRLDGAGNYQTLYVGGDDYRAQEFPDGSQQVINVYTLKARVD